jgi:hypothetical protein
MLAHRFFTADFGIHHEVQRFDEEFAHLAAVNDGVEHPVLEEEL